MEKLTDEARERIETVIEDAFDNPDEVGKLQSPLELHLFASAWNWDNATIEPLRRVIQDPRCDKGTAAFVYWMGDPVSLYEEAADKDEVKSEFRREHYDLFKEIEQRFVAGFYTQQNIRFDPSSDWIPGFTHSDQLKEPIPAVLVEPTPGITVEDEL